MEEWVARLPLLEARSHFNVSLNTSAVNEPSYTGTDSSRATIASLQLAQVQTLRTMHLALGVFSLALALLTVHRIVSDARRAAALQVTLRKQRFNSLQNVHPAETFPLALACGVVVSQIIFVAVQSTTLHSVLSKNCRMLAMITYPAIFAIGYITLTFGIETALRSFRSERFAPRGKWNTIVCIAAVTFLLLLTWIPTIVWPMFNRCFGSLIWFPMRYDLLTLVLLVVLISLLLLLAAIISIQLMRTANVDPNERIAASRMCYYLLLTAIIYTLVVPCEVQSLQEDFDAALGGSRFAEASLFSSGMVISFFHLFLRTNANRLVIRPMEEMRSESKQKRPKIRFFGPSDLEMNISGPLALQGGRRPDSRQGLIDVGPEKNRFDFGPEYFERPDRAITPGSKVQSPIDPTRWPLPPDMDEASETKKGHERKASYSIFPTRADDVPRLPATVYNPARAAKGESRISKLAMRRFNRRSSVTDVSQEFESMDNKPNPFFAMGRSRHASTDSSATVQIGLRFSLAPATLPAVKYASPTAPTMPKLNRSETDASNESIGLPLQVPSPTANAGDILLKPAVFSPPTQRALSPAKASPARTPAFPLTPSNSSAYLAAQREKVLPPAPVVLSPAARAESPLPAPSAMSGLRMNPVTPAASVAATSPTTTSPMSEAATSAPSTPQPLAVTLVRSNSGRTASPSPTARIPLGQGTMSRSPPPKGWL